MVTVGSYEAKTHLPQLLTRVAAGETVVITRHGQEIAHLVPALHQEAGGRAVRAAIANWRKRRKGVKLRGLKVRDLIAAGRR